MADQALADHRARAGYDVQDAGRKDVGGQLAQPQRGEWRHRCRLEHDSAARGERRTELPDRHHQRVVPRRDLAHDAGWLAPDHARVRGHVLGRGLALDHPRSAGEETHVVDRELDVEVGRSLGLADVLSARAATAFRRPVPRHRRMRTAPSSDPGESTATSSRCLPRGGYRLIDVCFVPLGTSAIVSSVAGLIDRHRL